jgi:hypothetical protein
MGCNDAAELRSATLRNTATPSDSTRVSSLARCGTATVSSMDNLARAVQPSINSLTHFSHSIWKYIRVGTVHGIHRLQLLTRLTWLTSHIKNVAVQLPWDTAFDESYSDDHWHTEIRGEVEAYFFQDRQAVLSRLVEAGHVGEDDEDPAYFEDGKLRKYTRGPDGVGFDPVIKTADDAIESLESSILRLKELQRLIWQTAIFPMPSSVCRHLSQLDSLRLLRLEQQGEFRSSSEYCGRATLPDML